MMNDSKQSLLAEIIEFSGGKVETIQPGDVTIANIMETIGCGEDRAREIIHGMGEKKGYKALYVRDTNGKFKLALRKEKNA